MFPYQFSWLESSLEDNSIKPKWTTCNKYPIKPRVLWARWQDAATLIGVRFGSSTEYAMIDVDSSSQYLSNPNQIVEALETIGICRVVILQSSWSGGIHIYIPLPKKYPTFSVALAIKSALEAQNIEIGPGQAEIFPNCKAYARAWLGEKTEYNGHRLPLQPGSGSLLLSSDLNPLPDGQNLSKFFALWDNAKILQDETTLSQAIALARANRRGKRRSVGPVESWKADLEAVIGEGWTGRGQTNQLLKEIGTYGRVFLALEGPELAEYIERTATTSPGYERWCGHHSEIWRKACTWGRAVERYYWPLGSAPLRVRPSLASICQERANDARQRIAAAMEQLNGFKGTIKALAKELVSIARTSMATLYKNRDLWHPCPPPPPPPDREPVTNDGAGVVGPLGAIRAQILESLQSADLAWVTGQGGENEGLAPATCPKKIFTSPGEGGLQGGKGLSPGSTDD